MAKNLLFLLLICSLYLGIASFSAAPERTSFEGTSTNVESCDAPAPDSFRVTNAGTNFVNLMWQPAWPSATQTLAILKKNTNSNSWESVDTIYNLAGASYTFSNAEYGSTYRFVIATNCTNGGISERTSTIDHVELILDLTIAGRTPVNPVIVPGLCPTIFYQAYNWVGFKIQTIPAGFIPISTLYEFTTSIDNNGNLYPVIKRVNPSGPIYAVGAPLGGTVTYPKSPSPLVITIYGPTSFMVRHYLSETNFIPVGNVHVNLVESGNGNTVQICIDDPNWNQGYTLLPLIASMANGIAPPNGSDISNDRFSFSKNFKAQNPFNEMLNIFVSQDFTSEGNASIRLITLSGQTVFEQHLEISNELISIPTNMVAPGFYILRIENNGETQALKVFKIE